MNELIIFQLMERLLVTGVLFEQALCMDGSRTTNISDPKYSSNGCASLPGFYHHI